MTNHIISSICYLLFFRNLCEQMGDRYQDPVTWCLRHTNSMSTAVMFKRSGKAV